MLKRVLILRTISRHNQKNDTTAQMYCTISMYVTSKTISRQNQKLTQHHNYSCIPIQYFWLVFGWYFLVITIQMPEENSVGTFWYYYFGRNPFFPRKGGHGPLLQGPSPHFEEKRVSRQTFKSSRQIL